LRVRPIARSAGSNWLKLAQTIRKTIIDASDSVFGYFAKKPALVLLMLGLDMLATKQIPNGSAIIEESLAVIAGNLNALLDQLLAQLRLRFSLKRTAKLQCFGLITFCMLGQPIQECY